MLPPSVRLGGDQSAPAKRRFGSAVIEVATEVVEDVDRLPKEATCNMGGIRLYVSPPMSMPREKVSLVHSMGVDKTGKAVPLSGLPLKLQEGWYEIKRFGIGPTESRYLSYPNQDAAV